ncbi:MAG: hypothetical protein J6031_06265 [Bacteroidales bacterium]|nr:hypothetical protein [Bacteroidales bacterium]
MTTHVFIVDDTTLKYHLEYMFAGTGSKNNDVDFNQLHTTSLSPNTENILVGMMADGCRVRKDDLIIFYLQAVTYNKKNGHDGMFFGVFQAVDDCVFLDRNDGKQFLEKKLGKSLTFRLKIKPYEVYAKGVTEWAALDEINNICSPSQMLWSLIYRKLKGNRGNTMITIYEAERLINLISSENNHQKLAIPANHCLTYDAVNKCITTVSGTCNYSGRTDPLNIVPRLVSKYNRKNAHEVHLQMYITQNIGRGTNASLDRALGILGKNLEWIGNEVSCGVGMRRIDVMVSVKESETKRILIPIELKAVPAYKSNTFQLTRYIDWIEQYYIPNRTSIIQPVLICKSGKALSDPIIQLFNDFNKRKGILPLIYIEYIINGNDIVFNQVAY